MRAHLARLLREIALDKEARSEGTAILNELERIGNSPDESPQHSALMQQLKDVRAAALEASGIDRSASAVYSECIENRLKTCGRFDGSIVAWFREWWVGRGYGLSVVRTGQSEQTIVGLQAKLASGTLDPSGLERRLSCLQLAYIHEARGDQNLADQLWGLFLNPDSQARMSPADTQVVERTGSQ
jgi:hypothetical protein